MLFFHYSQMEDGRMEREKSDDECVAQMSPESVDRKANMVRYWEFCPGLLESGNGYMNESIWIRIFEIWIREGHSCNRFELIRPNADCNRHHVRRVSQKYCLGCWVIATWFCEKSPVVELVDISRSIFASHVKNDGSFVRALLPMYLHYIRFK